MPNRTRRPALVAAVLLLAAAATTQRAAAQASPYAAETDRDIKALSQAEVDDLLTGAGMGFAKAAELNGVPGPRHVLDMAAELGVDDAQRPLIEDVFARMHGRAVRLGAEVVDLERELDAAFAAGQPTPQEVATRAVDLGRLYGELRANHLAAHLETAALLTPRQIVLYRELRGNAAGEGPRPHEPAVGDEHRHR